MRKEENGKLKGRGIRNIYYEECSTERMNQFVLQLLCITCLVISRIQPPALSL